MKYMYARFVEMEAFFMNEIFGLKIEIKSLKKTSKKGECLSKYK